MATQDYTLVDLSANLEKFERGELLPSSWSSRPPAPAYIPNPPDIPYGSTQPFDEVSKIKTLERQVEYLTDLVANLGEIISHNARVSVDLIDGIRIVDTKAPTSE